MTVPAPLLSILRAVAVALAFSIWSAAAALAQDTTQANAEATAEATPEAIDDGLDEPVLLTDEEIDTLVAPVALYPDALLAQVLVAATYPFEIMKADRWVAENAEIAQDQRTDAVQAENWDESVSVLAAGFPTVVKAMAADIDQTEQLGNAMLVQSDDVLDSIQRLRAQADAVGNLKTNEAQTVTVEGDNITIEPANPEVVYVPTYDSKAVYTEAPTAQPVIVDSSSAGFSTGALVTTGLLSFGAGMLVNEIFDDDDDWYGYWGPPRGGYYGNYARPIGWGGGYVRPRPVVGGIGNDVNIDIDRNRVGVRGGDRTNIRGGDRANIRGGDRVANIDKDGRWRPDDRRRNEARDKISKRKGPDGARNRAGGGDRDALRQKLDKKGGGAAKLKQKSSGASKKNLEEIKKRDGGGGQKLANRKAGTKQSAISRKDGIKKTKKAADRGKVSRQKAGLAKNAKARPKNTKKAGNINRPKKTAAKSKPQRKAGGGKQAFNKKGGGRKAGKAAQRGGKSRGGKKRR